MPTGNNGLPMLCHRFKGFADRLEQLDIGHQRQGDIDKTGQPPFGALQKRGLAHPAEHLLDAPYLGGLRIHAHQFRQGVDLFVLQRTGFVKFWDVALLAHPYRACYTLPIPWIVRFNRFVFGETFGRGGIIGLRRRNWVVFARTGLGWLWALRWLWLRTRLSRFFGLCHFLLLWNKETVRRQFPSHFSFTFGFDFFVLESLRCLSNKNFLSLKRLLQFRLQCAVVLLLLLD